MSTAETSPSTLSRLGDWASGPSWVSRVLSLLKYGPVLVTLAIADGQPDGSDCCFTQTCPNGQSAEHCTDDNCPSGTVCSGDGGCNPVVWAKAECIDEPVGP